MSGRGSSARHLGWEGFQTLVAAGPPAVEPITGEPAVELFTDPHGARIGLRTPSLGVEFPPSPLVEIDVRSVAFGGGPPVIEVSTGNRDLYRDFYAFACAVADRLQVDHLPPDRAIADSLDAWSALLERLVVLSSEKQIGLLGELWALERVGVGYGLEFALQAWKGPEAEEHDFSLQTRDIEVKTTGGERRVHIISALTQLLPNPDRPLYLLSVQLTDAGGGDEGWTLSERVEELGIRIRSLGAAAESGFRARLEKAGWQDVHREHYRRRFRLRTQPALVPVDNSCPAIVPTTLETLGEARTSRILQVSYRVNVTGLGFEDGAPEFLSVLPGATT
jgi:hypothetical protein